MNISLTAELESWIQQKNQTDFYQSASEVVRDALRLLRDYESLRTDTSAGLKSDILLGINDLEQGNFQKFDNQLLDDIKARGRQRLIEN